MTKYVLLTDLLTSRRGDALVTSDSLPVVEEVIPALGHLPAAAFDAR